MKSTAKKIRGLDVDAEREFKRMDAERSRNHPNSIRQRTDAKLVSSLMRFRDDMDKLASRSERAERREEKKLRLKGMGLTRSQIRSMDNRHYYDEFRTL